MFEGSALVRARLEVSVKREPGLTVGAPRQLRGDPPHWNTITLDGGLSDHRVRDIIEDP